MKSKLFISSIILLGILLSVVYKYKTFPAVDLLPEDMRGDTKEILLSSLEEPITDQGKIHRFFACMDKLKVRKSIYTPAVDGGISLKVVTGSSSISIQVTGKYISVNGDVYRTSQDVSDEIHAILNP